VNELPRERLRVRTPRADFDPPAGPGQDLDDVLGRQVIGRDHADRSVLKPSPTITRARRAILVEDDAELPPKGIKSVRGVVAALVGVIRDPRPSFPLVHLSHESAEDCRGVGVLARRAHERLVPLSSHYTLLLLRRRTTRTAAGSRGTALKPIILSFAWPVC